MCASGAGRSGANGGVCAAARGAARGGSRHWMPRGRCAGSRAAAARARGAGGGARPAGMRGRSATALLVPQSGLAGCAPGAPRAVRSCHASSDAPQPQASSPPPTSRWRARACTSPVRPACRNAPQERAGRAAQRLTRPLLPRRAVMVGGFPRKEGMERKEVRGGRKRACCAAARPLSPAPRLLCFSLCAQR